MDTRSSIFVKSCRMCVDGNAAWFVSWDNNELFYYNLQTEQCQYVVALPQYETHSICEKWHDDIYCLPDMGNEIMVYSLSDKKMQKISVDNLHGDRLLMMNCFQSENRLWAVSSGLNQIVEINPQKREIENYYTIFNQTGEIIGQQAILEGNDIFCVSRTTNRICKFSTVTKEKEYYAIDKMEGGINTIHFDGKRFWLSGCRKRICIWDMENNDIICLDDFPVNTFIDGDGSEVYQMPLFSYSIGTKEAVWFTPVNFQDVRCSKVIYINKKNYKINIYEHGREPRQMRGNCLFQYVLEERYLGIAFPEELYVTEIDAGLGKEIHKRMFLHAGDEGFMKKQVEKKAVKENGVYNLPFFLKQCEKSEKKDRKKLSNIGVKIMKEMKEK